MKNDDCQAYQAALFELVDDTLPPQARQHLDAHLAHCPDCTEQLSMIWQLQAAASNWQDQPVPDWARTRPISGSEPAGTWQLFNWQYLWSRLQWAGNLASLILAVVVLSQVQVSAENGIQVRFGADPETLQAATAVTLKDTLDERLAALDIQQQARWESSVQQLNDQQRLANQLLLRTVLDTSRQERRDDLRSVVSLVEEIQAAQAQQTNNSLRYLVASQAEDQRNIQQLGRALLNANARSTLTEGNQL